VWNLPVTAESAYAMPKLKNPTCANCGAAMKQRPSHENKTVLTVFECTKCGITFYTEDHVPLTGLASVREDSLTHCIKRSFQ
jgi:ribosomal protein L37AE/L43A